VNLKVIRVDGWWQAWVGLNEDSLVEHEVSCETFIIAEGRTEESARRDAAKALVTLAREVQGLEPEAV
jgi:hypothetical protein